MYAKLVLRNVRRSVKDYMIYIMTLTICVMLFYAFLSISSDYYHPNLGVEYDIAMLGDMVKYSVCAIALLLFFLTAYVNRYMIHQKQKEFALQTLMGMEQRTTARLFFAETLCMGMVSVILGIALGMVASQFVTAMLLSSFGEKYRITWTLFPDTTALTVGVFLLIFGLIGFKNVKTIRKIRIIDMLNAGKQGDGDFKKSLFMPVLSVLLVLVKLIMVRTAFVCLTDYYDPRFAFPAKIMYWGNLLLPILGLFSFLVWTFWKKRKTDIFIFIWMLSALLEGSFAASVPGIVYKYYLPYHGGLVRQYQMILIADMIYFVCALFYLSGGFLTAWKERSVERKYRGENLFFYGQLLSKLKTTTKTMSVITITMALSVFLFAAVPALVGWAQGYLDLRAVFDIQIFSSYNKVYEEADLKPEDFGAVTTYLEEKGIEVREDCLVEMYLPKKEQFRQRIKYEFPVRAISLSDYNMLRNMCGYEAVALADDRFMVHFQSIMMEEERREFLEENAVLDTDGGTLLLSEDSSRDEALGETLYNSYTDAIYIVPDEICRKLFYVVTNRYLNTVSPLSIEQVSELERFFAGRYPNTDESRAGHVVQTRTYQVNDSRAGMFTIKIAMTYGALVLLIICFTVLSLQLLSDAPSYHYRFGILRNMGVDEAAINRLAVRQIAVWFGMPVLVSLAISVVATAFFFRTISAEITAYIGAGVLCGQVAVIAVILALLLLCYFAATWILFIRAVK